MIHFKAVGEASHLQEKYRRVKVSDSVPSELLNCRHENFGDLL